MGPAHPNPFHVPGSGKLSHSDKGFRFLVGTAPYLILHRRIYSSGDVHRPGGGSPDEPKIDLFSNQEELLNRQSFRLVSETLQCSLHDFLFERLN